MVRNRTLGQNDIPSNEEGRAQASQLADVLASKRVSRVLSSPLARAMQTAQAIADCHRLPVQPDGRLTDLFRFQIDLASTSAALLHGDRDPRIVLVNWTPSLP